MSYEKLARLEEIVTKQQIRYFSRFEDKYVRKVEERRLYLLRGAYRELKAQLESQPYKPAA